MFKVRPENKGGGGRVVPGRRLWLTKDRERLVEDGDPSAAVLYCGPGTSVPEAEYKSLLGEEPEKKEAPAKPKPRAKKKSASKKRSTKGSK